MNQGWGSLLQTLKDLVEAHGLLVEVLRQERADMEQLNYESLSECVRTKQAALGRIQSLEEDRQNQVALLGVENQDQLISLLKAESSPLLIHFHSVLEALKQSLVLAKGENEQNAILAKSALENIEEMKRNALGQNNNNAENYSAKGSRNPISQQGGRLLSQEA